MTWNSQYKSLDHWRGLAALWVMMFHGFGTTFQTQLHPVLEVFKAIAAPGWLGVNLFFVISGYCIVSSAYRSTLKDSNPVTFLKNRFWRLVPTYWIAFFCAIALNIISSPFNKVSLSSLVPMSWQVWLGNLLLIQPYLNIPGYVVVYWSLAAEIGFYLIVAGLLVISDRFGQKTALMIGVSTGVASVFINSQWAVLTAWCEFVCGGLLFLALLAQAKERSHHRNLALCIVLTVGILSLWTRCRVCPGALSSVSPRSARCFNSILILAQFHGSDVLFALFDACPTTGESD
jgi:peptidoglycan/LPS O-acetylase OafA/YrhL